MISLVVLVLVTLLSRALGFVWNGSETWLEATRLGLAAMFVVTGLSHFSPRLRLEFIRMVPPMFPVPAALVTLTGVLALLGAVGLLLLPLRPYAAVGLGLLLALMLPANLYASGKNLPLGGRPPTPLPIRIPMQVLYLGLTLWIALA